MFSRKINCQAEYKAEKDKVKKIVREIKAFY